MLLLVLACAHAPEPRHETAQVRVEAAADEDWLGVRFQLAPGWHIYWLNPGDSGMATEVEAASDTVTLGAARFPGPERFLSPGDITSYGWSDEVVVLLPIEGEGQVAVEATWLVCKDVCHYQQARLRASTKPTRDLSEHVLALPGSIEATAHEDGWLVPGVDLFPSSELDLALGERRIDDEGIFFTADGGEGLWGLVRDADGRFHRFDLETP